MPQGLLIFGPAGSGKTTLGRRTAQRLGLVFLDIDDYIWRKDTPQPFSLLYPREERIARLMAAARRADTFVMAGSMSSFHQFFDPMFRLAVYLDADAALRVERARRRELEQFGERVLPGGDMEEIHRTFLREQVAGYDAGSPSEREKHLAWERALVCPVLHLDGGRPLAELEEQVANAWSAEAEGKSCFNRKLI